MTDLTTYQPQQVEYLSPALADPTGGRLVAWAEGLTAAHRIGAALCQTAFVPVHFKNKPEEAAAAILYGDEIGLTPTQALQNLYVISGKPALYARAMVALVLAAGHEVWTVSKSDAQVTVAGRRRGSSHTIEETWTTARASKAGYTNNKKYQSDPQAMLYARAASDVCRQVAPDALAGLAYSVEESELEEQQPATVTKRTERATTAKRAAAPEIPEPEVLVERIDEAEVVEPVNRNARGVDESGPFVDRGAEPTKKQTALMWVLLGEKFPTEAEQKEYLHLVVDREWTSTTEFSRGDVSKVIDSLGGAA